jgi:hypothetical protein
MKTTETQTIVSHPKILEAAQTMPNLFTRGLKPKGRYVPEFHDLREQLLHSEKSLRGIEKTVNLLSAAALFGSDTGDLASFSGTSYELKHRVEKHIEFTTGRHEHVFHGSAILAAILCGYRFKEIGTTAFSVKLIRVSGLWAYDFIRLPKNLLPTEPV